VSGLFPAAYVKIQNPNVAEVEFPDDYLCGRGSAKKEKKEDGEDKELGQAGRREKDRQTQTSHRPPAQLTSLDDTAISNETIHRGGNNNEEKMMDDTGGCLVFVSCRPGQNRISAGAGQTKKKEKKTLRKKKKKKKKKTKKKKRKKKKKSRTKQPRLEMGKEGETQIDSQ